MERSWQELYDMLLDMRGRLLLALAEGGIDNAEAHALLAESDVLEARVLAKIASMN